MARQTLITLTYGLEQDKCLTGRGVVSPVYKGRYLVDGTETEKEVAIKVYLKDRLSKEWKRDLELLKRPDRVHDNFIRFICSMETPDFLYIVTEYCQYSVADLFNINKDQEVVADFRIHLGAVEILRQSTEGVAFLHGYGYVHRNLKPSNFRLAHYQHGDKSINQVKITDFKNSKNVEIFPTNSGTRPAEWFAPECNETGCTLGRSVDVFVLGTYYFYVLFGGNHPFQQDDCEISYNIVNRDHPIYKWANDWGNEVAAGNPWESQNLPERYEKWWKDTSGFQQGGVVSLVENAIDLIRRMLTKEPHLRWDLKRVSESELFKPKSSSTYPIYDSVVEGKAVGLCLIFCQSQFQREGLAQLDDLPGNEHSASMLGNTFADLGFDVKCYKNRTANEIEIIIEETAKNNDSMKQYYCLVVIFLSHGDISNVYSSDGNSVSISEMQAKFNSHICRSMHNKPKVFIVDACRVFKGEYDTLNSDINGGLTPREIINRMLARLQPTNEEAEAIRLMLERPIIPTSAISVNNNMSPVNDMVTIMSTSDYTRAWTGRNNTASRFATTLCELLNSAGCDDKKDLDTVLRMLQKKMSECVIATNEGAVIQTPGRLSCLRKHIVFWKHSVTPSNNATRNSSTPMQTD